MRATWTTVQLRLAGRAPVRRAVRRHTSLAQRKPTFPVGALRLAAHPRRGAVAPAVRRVAEVRAAAEHPPVAFRRAGRVHRGRGWSRCQRGRTSGPRSTPTRCRSCCRGRSRWAGTRRPARCRRTRPPRCCRPGTAPGTRSSGARRRASSSSPHGKRCCSSPPRAAYSHSASVGSRARPSRRTRSASFHDTWTTGWSARPSTRTAGPPGAPSRRPRPRATTARRRPRGSAGSRRAGSRRRRTPSRTSRLRWRTRWRRRSAANALVGHGVTVQPERAQADRPDRPLAVLGVRARVLGPHGELTGRERHQVGGVDRLTWLCGLRPLGLPAGRRRAVRHRSPGLGEAAGGAAGVRPLASGRVLSCRRGSRW